MKIKRGLSLLYIIWKEDLKMKCILVEAGKESKVVNIDSNLENLQKIVGGYIEIVYPFSKLNLPTMAIICNEEGKIRNLKPNRIFTSDFYDFDDIIYGDFLIVDTNSEDFIDLEEPFSSFFSLMLDATTYMIKEDFKC